ncbi:MAG: hypothetical protein ACRD26_04425 [Vicinamibacterales bacterium]
MIGALLVLFAWGDGAPRDVVHVPCVTSGPACAEALQAAIDAVPAGTTLTLDPGKVYDGTIVVKPKPGADAETRLTITTRGWKDKGDGWDGLVTPDDKPRMAVLRGSARSNAGIEIQNGPTGGHLNLVGLAFEAIPPAGQGELIRIGSGSEREAANMARHITIRQVLLQGSRQFGQKRGISANGRDIDIRQVWCEEIFVAGQDAQCVGSWNGGQRVRVRHSYLAAGAENVIIGGAPIASAEMLPEDWLIEDVILHKPLRWQQDGRNRQVKNLLELKHGRNITVRRVLAVNTWRAAQDGTGLLVNYTTNGRCPQCGNLEHVLIEDLVMLNVAAGVSFQGYSWQRNSHNDGKLRDVTLRNVYVQLSRPGRTIEIANVLDRHDIRIERSTFINRGPAWLTGSYGRAWPTGEASTPGGPMEGVWLVDNVFTSNGRYGITAPDGHHYGTGLDAFVAADLQIAGNVIGDAPPAHLARYNTYRNGGDANVSASRAAMTARLTADACAEWSPGKGADCARLEPVFDLLKLLPEP